MHAYDVHRSLIFGTFLQNNIVGCKTDHGFIVKLKSFEFTRFLKGQDVNPN